MWTLPLHRYAAGQTSHQRLRFFELLGLARLRRRAHVNMILGEGVPRPFFDRIE
jgi:hypothetical protein